MLDTKILVEVIVRIAISVIIGGIIGIEREYKNRPAGMRTHVLVSLGSMSIALLEYLIRNEFKGMDSATSFTFGRLSAQVISGIGFLGAGTIFMSKRKIGGLTTAASLWCTACLGLMVGFGHYWVALAICVVVILVLALLQRLIHVNAIKMLEVRFINRGDTMQFINEFFDKNDVKVLDIDFYIENADNKKDDKNIYKNIYTLRMPQHLQYTTLVVQLSEYKNIQAVHTRNV